MFAKLYNLFTSPWLLVPLVTLFGMAAIVGLGFLESTSKSDKKVGFRIELIAFASVLLILGFDRWIEEGYIGGESHMYTATQKKVIKYRTKIDGSYVVKLENGKELTIDGENVDSKTVISDINKPKSAYITLYTKNKRWNKFNYKIPKNTLTVIDYKNDWIKTS